jgi:hypothetical protein
MRAAEAAFEAADLKASHASTAASAPLVDPTTGSDLRLDPNKLNVAQLQVPYFVCVCVCVCEYVCV